MQTSTMLRLVPNGVIGLGSDVKADAIYWAYTENTNFYEVSEDMKTITKVSANALSTDSNDKVYFVADDDATASYKVVKTVIVQKEKDAGGPAPTGSYIISSTGTVGVAISGGKINTTGSSIYGSTTDTAGSAGNAALNNVVVSYEISTWNGSTSSWNAPVIVKSATQATVAAGTYIDAGTNAQAAYSIPSGVDCKVTVTVTSNEDTTTFASVTVQST